jgi:hypothetical protein
MRKMRKPARVINFDGMPLPAIVGWLAKAGVKKYDPDVLHAVTKYAWDYTSIFKSTHIVFTGKIIFSLELHTLIIFVLR